MDENNLQSPCIDVCKIDQDRGWCRGCLRTRDEIKGWRTYSDAERIAVLEQLAGRRR
jgi:predicted Fe-S protein YdhL (DUF1289 family)